MDNKPTHPAPRLTFYVSRITVHISRIEPVLILLLAPFLIFPQPDRTPWLMVAVPLLWLCRWLGRGRLTVRTPLDVPLLIMLAMTVVSLWATFDLTRSFAKLCGVFLGISLFYALVNSIRTEKGVWLATGLILAGGAGIAGMSLVGTQWGAHKIPLLLPFLLPLYERLPRLLSGIPRAEEGFSTNQIGGTLTLFVPLVATLLLYRVTSVIRSDHSGRHSVRPQRSAFALRRVLLTLGLGGALALIALVLLLTQSRLAYLTTILTLLLLGASQGRWPRLVAAVTLLLGIGIVATYGPEQVSHAIFGIPNLETMTSDLSWTARVEIWKRALRIIQDHPLTGIGFDTLYPVMHARYPTFIIAAGSDLAHAHNIYLQVTLDLGLPGLVAFAWLLVAFGWMLWRAWRGADSHAHRALAAGLFFGVLAQMIYGLADAIALGQKPGIFLWACFGLGTALYSIALPAPSTARSRITSSHLQLHVSRSSRWVICLLVALSLAGWGYRQIAHARTWLSLIEADFATLQTLTWEGPSAIAPWQPEELLHTTQSDLRGLQAEFTLPLTLAPHLGWMPGYGADLQSAPLLLQMSLRLTSTAGDIFESLGPLLSRTLASSDREGLEVALTTLQAARPQLTQASATLEEIKQTRRAIRAARLSPSIARWLSRFDQMVLVLENSVEGAMALPELLGASEPRTYLILLQNEDELRPTGGFITGVARVTLDEGRVVELIFEDSYAVDNLSHPYPAAPPPLVEIMGTELWFFRDSNWSPDFPTSAQVATVLYWLGHDDVSVDGVLALDQHALQLFVTALEPLDLEEYPEPVTGENMVRAVRASWAPSGERSTDEWWEHRKDLMGRLLTAAVYKLQDNPSQVNLTSLGWAALRSLEDKHASVYLTETGPLADMLHQAGWDGAIADKPGDYLMVVDANLGFNKVNSYITETLSYTVDLSDPVWPRARLALSHRHEGRQIGGPCRHESRYDLTYEQMMERCYWDYVRVYVPEGSHLLEATPHPVSGSLLLRGEGMDGEARVLPSEGGKAVFATFLVLSPGEWTETRFTYNLPQVVERDGDIYRYRLTIQKQGGTEARHVQVVLNLPTGAQVVAASPPPARRDRDALLYELRLQSDIELSVDWERKPE